METHEPYFWDRGTEDELWWAAREYAQELACDADVSMEEVEVAGFRLMSRDLKRMARDLRLQGVDAEQLAEVEARRREFEDGIRERQPIIRQQVAEEKAWLWKQFLARAEDEGWVFPE